jgi:hypothetical protein
MARIVGRVGKDGVIGRIDLPVQSPRFRALIRQQLLSTSNGLERNSVLARMS